MLPFKIIPSKVANPPDRHSTDNVFIITRRQRALLNPQIDEEEPSPHVPTGPKKDYTLKEGQTFSINIPGRNKASGANTGSLVVAASKPTSTLTSNASIPLLPPPPSATRKR